MSKAEEVFRHELSLIRDAGIKEFVLKVFDRLAPGYFWTCPASTSGKYHPAISLGEGGLVRHVQYAVWWAEELIKVRDLESGDWHDEIIAALLLHDLKKNGEAMTPAGKPTLADSTAFHGIYLGEQIELRMYPPGNGPSARERRIIDAIKTHMGRWTTMGHPQPSSDVEHLVHLADYCASRRADGVMEEMLR